MQYSQRLFTHGTRNGSPGHTTTFRFKEAQNVATKNADFTCKFLILIKVN
jgi:hypothetical protein